MSDMKTKKNFTALDKTALSAVSGGCAACGKGGATLAKAKAKRAARRAARGRL